ncbi:hypothetical protein OESDEN_10350 [Oesophagostomum dentatum]|uniref:DNA polymerase delta subunit OB-fold domain-containing protein n=1 Tax=Oesophagostomum dentatum TaxID=61180 RepID=A0A0B1T334_OESDE|nr:hypothetical protein OESDEN_10350 [Oesophagostomum dentatum]
MVQCQRMDLSYTNRSKKYELTAEDKQDAFERQYYHVYAARLELLKPRILEAGKKILGMFSNTFQSEDVEYKQLEDLEMFEKAFVIGTIEKRISKRPGVLKEIAEEELIVPEDYDGDEMMSIVSNKDFLEFEDEKQIVKLQGNISMDEVATGCTVGLYGSQVKSDVFNVEQIIWPTPRPQRPWPSKKTGGVVAFISGLELTGDAANDVSSSFAFLFGVADTKKVMLKYFEAVVISSFELMSSWLNQELFCVDSASLAARVERMVVLGDSIAVGQVRFFFSSKQLSAMTSTTSLIYSSEWNFQFLMCNCWQI